MKNLDIENLERKNIYKTPENFFSQMQDHVLQKTLAKKEPKVVKLNFNWAIAAAISLIFGLSVFFYTTKKTVKNPTNFVENRIENQTKGNETAQNNQNKTSATIEYETMKKEIEAVETQKATNIKSIAKNDQNKIVLQQTPKNEVTMTNNEQFDQVLAVLSNEELAELSKNSDQDVYLDLYN